MNAHADSDSAQTAVKEDKLRPPKLDRSGLAFRFDLTDGLLRPIWLLPTAVKDRLSSPSQDFKGGSEVELQCTNRNWPEHHAKKLIGGNPGKTLLYTGRQTLDAHHEILLQHDPELELDVQSHYRFFEGIPVVRRWTRIQNRGRAPVGIEHASSAMLYNFGNFGPDILEKKLRVHYAYNSWMIEGQWHEAAPSQLGYIDSGFSFNLSAISFSNLGSWSTMTYLPMGMVENRDIGVTWFWQIEHSGPWHWEISDGNGVGYLYLGGPDALYSQAWKQLKPGAVYETAPVAIGCVQGGFNEAVAALTAYRRKACLPPHRDNRNCHVIFNDYMGCLNADPTTEKELPYIDAAAAAGCEYYVIDAGWYAEKDEVWWDTVGLWQTSKTRWNHGLKDLMDKIRARGMTPGLWLEIEVAGIQSPLKSKPDSWFFCRHGQRVMDNGRYFLDFRNPEVCAHADEAVNRLIHDYDIGYIKMDYNVDALMGTERDADSFGQGMLEHRRAYLKWIDRVHDRFPDLAIENCSSGGGRMDYGMLSHHQLQSASDQMDYRRYPSIVVGELAAILPEQLGVWSVPKKDGNADEASFNMVNAMLCRIHQSGELAYLKEDSWREIVTGIRIYKEHIRPFLGQMTPFFPLGMPSMVDTISPVAVGLRGADRAFLAAWRLTGAETVKLPKTAGRHYSLLYPTERGIELKQSAEAVEIHFPRQYMGAILSEEPLMTSNQNKAKWF